MTRFGGTYNKGVVFQMNSDGSGFQLLHSFAGGAGDGRLPLGSLTLAGSTLYGMTQAGGDSDLGTMFQMNTDGSGYQLLREFAGGDNDGRYPSGDLTLSGSTLYGMTPSGGNMNYGTVFAFSAIPEPLTIGIIALLGGAMLGWRRLRSWHA